MIGLYILDGLMVSLLIYIHVRVASGRLDPIVVREPERCASCGAVLPSDSSPHPPVEFSQVPVPLPMFGPKQYELTVRFKVCQPCCAGPMVA